MFVRRFIWGIGSCEKSKLKLIESEGSRIRVKWFGQAPTEGQIKKSQIL
jgi:hypothetical protein